MMDIRLAAKPAPARWYLLNEFLLLPLLSFLVVLGAWEAAADAGWLDTFFFSSPSRIVGAGIAEVVQSRFWNDVQVSLFEFAVGYFGAVIVAVPFGLATGWYRPAHYFFEPWLNAFNATPRIALLPLIVLWIGLGIWSKVAVVFLGVFFPLAVNTFHGVRTVDSKLLDVTTSFGAPPGFRFRTLILPSVVPFILVGARIGIGRATTGVLVGEFYSSDAGLGRMILKAGQTLQTDRLLFGAVLIMIVALTGFWLIDRLERRFDQWRPKVGAAA